MTDRDSLEQFNRRLDALLSGADLPEAGSSEQLTEAQRHALEVAASLAVLNPSRESRSRYPLRRRLAGGPDRPVRQSWKTSALRLTPGLALLFVVMCVFVGAAAGLSASPTQAATLPVEQTAVWQPAAASVPAGLEQPGQQLHPLRAPTPLVQPGATTLVPQNTSDLQTPGRPTPSGVNTH